MWRLIIIENGAETMYQEDMDADQAWAELLSLEQRTEGKRAVAVLYCGQTSIAIRTVLI